MSPRYITNLIARAFDGAGRAQPRPGAQRRLRDEGSSVTRWDGSSRPASGSTSS
jgi:hypothetical protein